MHKIRLALVVLLLSGCSALVNNALDESDGGAGTDAGPGDDVGPGGDAAADAGPEDSGPIDTMPPIDAGAPIDCTGMEDGTDCGESGICISDVCETSRCGDEYVNEDDDEECDDGNLMDEDGCDNDCTFSCSEPDHCDDGRFCNGESICGIDHICVDQAPPASGTECTGEGGAMGVCTGEICIPVLCGNGDINMGEECDDGNNTDGDGCEADCTYECENNADCDDGEYCTGVETCLNNNCEAGTAPAMAPEMCGNNIDDDCDGMTDETNPLCYDDNDGDGAHGGTGVRALSCICPAALSEDDSDCDDNDPRVFPGQRSFQLPPARNCLGQADCLPYDYNCDGAERTLNVIGMCRTDFNTCELEREGWVDRGPPACGQPGRWGIRCVGTGALMCVGESEERIQRCL